MEYFIHWKSITEKTGRGTKSFPKAQAESICKDLNLKDKDIQLIHWIEPAPNNGFAADGGERA